MSRRPLIIAHRGASHDAPENTLAAIRLAVESGVDGVEFDVRLAADGVPVLMHDATLRRTGMRTGMVRELTSAELAKVDVGSWFNKKNPARARAEYAHERVPTLRQALDLLTDFPGTVQIELKADVGDTERLVTAVCSEAASPTVAERVVFKSFSLAAVSMVRSLQPAAKIAAIFGPSISNFLRPKRSLDLALAAGADHISLHRSLAQPAICRSAAEQGIKTLVWTVDDPRWLKRAADLTITALITNRPDLLIGEGFEITPVQ